MTAGAPVVPGWSGVYRQPNGKYAVCFMLDGKPRFRAVDGDLDEARAARARLAIAARAGLLLAGPAVDVRNGRRPLA